MPAIYGLKLKAYPQESEYVNSIFIETNSINDCVKLSATQLEIFLRILIQYKDKATNIRKLTLLA